MKATRWVLILLMALTLRAAGDITGTWKVVFTGPKGPQPKMFNEVILKLNIEGDQVSGMAHMGGWPGDAPITDGKIEGDHFSFTAIGKLPSSSGFPKAVFAGTLHGNEMKLTMILGSVGRDNANVPRLEMEGTKISAGE
jgi:hypothetical protein